MIGRLRGVILEKQPPLVLLEANGVGYEVHMPMTCFYELPELGQEAIVFTQFVVREDAQLLYGFNDKQERALFRELIKVNGVGPKLALAILSGMSAQQFVSAVEREEITTLVKLPGVGKKTAERLVVEMKDRFKGLNGDLFNNSSEITLPSRRASRRSGCRSRSCLGTGGIGIQTAGSQPYGQQNRQTWRRLRNPDPRRVARRAVSADKG